MWALYADIWICGQSDYELEGNLCSASTRDSPVSSSQQLPTFFALQLTRIAFATRPGLFLAVAGQKPVALTGKTVTLLPPHVTTSLCILQCVQCLCVIQVICSLRYISLLSCVKNSCNALIWC